MFISRCLRGDAAEFFFLLRLRQLSLRSRKRRHRLVAEPCRASARVTWKEVRILSATSETLWVCTFSPSAICQRRLVGFWSSNQRTQSVHHFVTALVPPSGARETTPAVQPASHGTRVRFGENTILLFQAFSISQQFFHIY